MTPARHSRSRRAHPACGMTLLEMLLSMVILAMVILLIAYVMSVMQGLWVQLRGKADGYRNTRIALDIVAGRLSQATLNSRTVLNHKDGAPASSDPLGYVSESDLHFVTDSARELMPDNPKAVGRAVFFQAPFGKESSAKDIVGSNVKNQEDMRKLNATLNAWGYFVELGPDDDGRPIFMANNTETFPKRNRFRLLEFRLPSSQLTLFDMAQGPPPDLKINQAQNADDLYKWFREPLKTGNTYAKRHITVIAENIIAFAITPLDPKRRGANSNLADKAAYQIFPNSSDSKWNSRAHQLNSTADPSQRHSLPPALQLTAIAVSEDAWLAYANTAEDIQQVDRIHNELQTLVNGRFSDGKNIQSDIAAVVDYLDDRTKHPRSTIPYRVVTIFIPIAGH